MVVQYVLLFARRYWPQMMLPITIPVGYLGYCLEAKFRSQREAEPPSSIVAQREERRLLEMEGERGDKGGPQSGSTDSPKTISGLREERRLQNMSTSSQTTLVDHHHSQIAPHHTSTTSH